ncbi:MAG TPA: sulfur carrier protein ThiS [Bryobacteraceae bacterium]|nr:sulfur carrier protein ThiS [Bryobacteraceae bacterium]
MPSSDSALIEIVVNGETHTVPRGLNISGLLELLGLEPGRVAVELDRRIVRQPEWAGTRFEAGAKLEIVQFVGGG